MTDSTEAHEIDSKAVSNLDGYDSMMLQLYIETLAKRDREIHVLDMGPVCEENILYFSQRVNRFYICDMFIQMDRKRRKGKSTNSIWDQLDFPAQSFHGIHLWDLIEHLEDGDAKKMVELCHRMLKPKGSCGSIIKSINSKVACHPVSK